MIIFFEVKIKGIYGLIYGLIKEKVFEIGSFWDMFRCVVIVVFRVFGNYGFFGKFYEMLLLLFILFDSLLYEFVG